MSETSRTAVDVEVRYIETDQMGVVHHANYVAWFELARTRLCRDAGLHYAEIEERGFLLMVTGLEIKYRQGAKYGDTVQVSARIERLWSRGVRYTYEVWRDSALLATGASQHVWVDRESRKPVRLPADLERLMGRVAATN